LPAIALSADACRRHLERAFELFHVKEAKANWESYLDNLYPLDWFVASACLEGLGQAWEHLFAARAGRTDCLLVGALRARAARLYPRDEIGRASCRERVEIWGGGGSLKKKEWRG